MRDVERVKVFDGQEGAGRKEDGLALVKHGKLLQVFLEIAVAQVFHHEVDPILYNEGGQGD